jgi:superfamily II DNA or RNA helicase
MNKTSNETPEQTDPFNGYDTKSMLAASSDDIYKAGLLYFKDDRVIEHYQQQAVLYGKVEGGDSAFPYTVELSHDDAGHLHGRCDCSANHTTDHTADHTADSSEQTVGERLICKHAIATLLAFTESSDNSQLYSSAKDIAIRDRIKRGQTEVNVTHVDGLPTFGIWSAVSIVSTANVQQSYTVNIRSVSEKMNSCTCLDLANNQLATCKHIEAVLHQLAKENKNFPRPAPKPFVYRSFGLDADLRVQRTGGMTEATGKLIDRFFDAQGMFSGELPGDFFKFTDLIFGQDDILIGDDARQLVQSLLTKQANQVRALQNHQQVMATNGHLPGVTATLYPYQLEGVAFLAANGRGLLADDMGLGKTLQAIAGAMWLTHNSGAKKVLIVCPASLKHQWAREIEKFTGQSSQIIQGGPAKRHTQYTQDKTFFIVNYELVLRDLNIINEVLAPDLMILDEAQRIKNWRTKIATAIKLVRSQYAFVLTGTPLENRLEDLYSLMQVVSQDVLGPLWRFLSDYHILDESGKIQGYRNLSHLRQRISASMMRRNRSIVSDQLPGRTTLRLDVAMSKKQIELHDSAISTAGHIANIAKTRPLTPSERNRLMASLQQARMACDAAGLVDKKTKGSPKLNELKTLVEDLCIDGGRKMVVFSQWRTMTTMIEDMLRHMGVGCVHLHGGVPTNKRGQLMDDFASDDSIQVFVSTDAGGVRFKPAIGFGVGQYGYSVESGGARTTQCPDTSFGANQ